MKPAHANWLKTALYLAGALAGVAFLITKNPTALTWATSGDYRYGDLYRFAQIQRFKPAETFPKPAGSDVDTITAGRSQPDPDDFIFFGDSFGRADWGERPFSDQLGQELGRHVFNVFNRHHNLYWQNPCLFLNTLTNDIGTHHIIVYEVVERSVQQEFATPVKPDAKAAPEADAGSLSTSFKTLQDAVLENTEPRHEALLKHGVLTSPIVSLWNSAVFELFGQIPAETPRYSLDPPMLFFKDEVDCYEAEHSDGLVARLADNIAWLDRTLRTRYHCTLVFVPVPNKITVYARQAGEKPYDQFLPRLCAAAKSRGVRTVELLPRFEHATNQIYWSTDTHWNNPGIHLAVNETLKSWPKDGAQPASTAP